MLLRAIMCKEDHKKKYGTCILAQVEETLVSDIPDMLNSNRCYIYYFLTCSQLNYACDFVKKIG